jgi:hypothetical protein
LTRALILVEGQTEEAFVRDVLTPHLAGFAVYPVPVLLKTKRVKAGGAFRGGVTLARLACAGGAARSRRAPRWSERSASA